MKKIVYLGFALLASSAFGSTLSSKISGAWISPCTEMEGSSYQNEIVFSDDMRMTSVDLNYTGAGCMSAPSVESEVAPYRIDAEDQNSVIATLTPNSTVEGELVELTAQFYFPNATETQMKITSAIVIVGGNPTRASESEINKIPAITYTKIQ
jgi:hypothetical protein